MGLYGASGWVWRDGQDGGGCVRVSVRVECDGGVGLG